MKKTVIIIILFAAILFPQSVRSKIDKLLNDKFFETCTISISVEDISAGKNIYRKNEKLLLKPASNMKVLTSAAGLLFLGPDYLFSTDIYYDGFTKNDTLFGDIYIVGGCDPGFKTNDLNNFITALKSLDITVINGNLYGDVSFKDSLYWGKGWMWDDDPSPDAPYLSALNINDNCVRVEYNSKEKKYNIDPATNYVNVKRIESEDELIIDRDWFNRKNEILIKGKDDAKDYLSKINVLEPAKYFLQVFSEMLDSNQIRITGNKEIKTLNKQAVLLASVYRKFSDVVVDLNKESNNLSAEMTLLALSEKYYGKPAGIEKGIKLVQQMIDESGFNSKDYRIVDGSGVSHYNLVSTGLLAGLLKYLYNKNNQVFEILYNSFPIGGIDGTLENRMTDKKIRNNVHAKTGTLSGVSSLTGYLTNARGHIIAFSIIMQNYTGTSSFARQIQDEICKILSE